MPRPLHSQKRHGFTIVELLIVIVVIGILAAIVTIGYTGITERARATKIKADLNSLQQAILAAKSVKGKTLDQITDPRQPWYTAAGCEAEADATNLATSPKDGNCWADYLNALQAISDASGVNVTNLVDPWGRPYYIDENDGEDGNCFPDQLNVYSQPFVQYTTYGDDKYAVYLLLSNATSYTAPGCP